MSNQKLFSQIAFYEAAKSRRESVIGEIKHYEMAKILHTPTEDLVQYFEKRFKMDVPKLSDTPHLLSEAKEVPITTMRPDVFDDLIQTVESHIEFTICIPFEGDKQLLQVEPTNSTYQISGSKARSTEVVDDEIRLSYLIIANTPEEIERAYHGDVNCLIKNAKNLTTDAAGYNSELTTLINQKINERKQAAQKGQALIQSFKIPIKKRDDLPATYSIPKIQKKPHITKPQTSASLNQDPTLESADYESILTIMKDMSLAMERSPKTFFTLAEEDIRNFFLILLNGHYQGAATGETFNGAGKTDVLIRYQNQNAFIAECKFWKGQGQMKSAIDQLLGYITWRDTKTAIVLFNKKKDLSEVIKKAQEIITSHPNYKSIYKLTSPVLTGSGTIFGYKFTHPSDADKEIFLTLMAFQINKSD